jgi:hypothetical protein
VVDPSVFAWHQASLHEVPDREKHPASGRIRETGE